MTKIKDLSPVSFESKIKFVSQEEFNKKVPVNKIKQSDEYVKWKVRGHAKPVINKQNVFTDGIHGCNVGAVMDSDKVIMCFHQYPVGLQKTPDKRTLEAIQEIIKKRVSSNKSDSNDSLTGLIIGGGRYDSISRAYFNSIKKVFNELGIKFSIIWGQKELCLTDVYYSKEDDTWLVSTYKHKLKKSGYSKNQIKINNIEDLKNNYSDIYIRTGDELCFDENKISIKNLSHQIAKKCLTFFN